LVFCFLAFYWRLKEYVKFAEMIGVKIVEEFNLDYAYEAGNLYTLEKNIIEFSRLNNQQINDIKLNIMNIVEKDFYYSDQQLKLNEFISSLN